MRRDLLGWPAPHCAVAFMVASHVMLLLLLLALTLLLVLGPHLGTSLASLVKHLWKSGIRIELALHFPVVSMVEHLVELALHVQLQHDVVVGKFSSTVSQNRAICKPHTFLNFRALQKTKIAYTSSLMPLQASY